MTSPFCPLVVSLMRVVRLWQRLDRDFEVAADQRASQPQPAANATRRLRSQETPTPTQYGTGRRLHWFCARWEVTALARPPCSRPEAARPPPLQGPAAVASAMSVRAPSAASLTAFTDAKRDGQKKKRLSSGRALTEPMGEAGTHPRARSSGSERQRQDADGHMQILIPSARALYPAFSSGRCGSER